MGGLYSKAGEWNEVMTGNSPGSPDSEDTQKFTNNELAKRRILQVDPRSASDDVTRTPIQVDKRSLESTPKTKAPAFWDPRSPSNEPGLTRTPIVLSQARAPLNLDQNSYDDSKEDIIAAPPPSRGAVADLKDIETKVENLQLKDDVEEAEANEKEDGEITHDCNDSKNDDAVDDVPVTDDINEKHKVCQLTPELKKKEEVLSLEEKFEDYEKEEGEITHDSDDDDNDENIENLLVKKTPVKTNIRSKSSLESDCRSPLLIESSEPFFEKSLSSELAVMAAKNNAAARPRKPLGEVKTESNDDSLLI